MTNLNNYIINKYSRKSNKPVLTNSEKIILNKAIDLQLININTDVEKINNLILLSLSYSNRVQKSIISTIAHSQKLNNN